MGGKPSKINSDRLENQDQAKDFGHYQTQRSGTATVYLLTPKQLDDISSLFDKPNTSPSIKDVKKQLAKVKKDEQQPQK